MTQQLNPNIQFRDMIHALGDTIDEAILAALETNVSDQLLASLAEARGGIVKIGHVAKIVTISIANDEQRVYADELRPHGLEKYIDQSKPKPLPQLKPNKGVKRVGLKLRSPIDYDCPACGATAGTTCFKFDRKGANANVTEERHPESGPIHKSRQALSSQHNNQARRDYDRKHGLS